MNNRAVLDNALLRCNAERERTLGDPECINARKAVARIAALEEEERKTRLEAKSERKRDQLRRQRGARDRIVAARKERADSEAAVREMAEFTGTEDLPPTASPVETTAGGVANLPSDSAVKLPAGVSAAPVSAETNTLPATEYLPADGGAAVTVPAQLTTQPATQDYVDNDPISAGAQSMTVPAQQIEAVQGSSTVAPEANTPAQNIQTQTTVPQTGGAKSDDEIALEIERLETELRKRREAEILRLEEELRLRKQQNEAAASPPVSN